MRRPLLFASLFCLALGAARAEANSCANVTIMGTFDQSGLYFESDDGLYTAGTLRIADEKDESKQPMFNIAMVTCQRQLDEDGKGSMECKLSKASVSATSDKPDIENPNCSLDLDISEYTMKELQKGVLSGMDNSTSCYNSTLTINRNTKRVYLSFTRTQYADNYDKIRPGTCAAQPRTQVMMNCTPWARMRQKGQTAVRYCDFSGASSK